MSASSAPRPALRSSSGRCRRCRTACAALRTWSRRSWTVRDCARGRTKWGGPADRPGTRAQRPGACGRHARRRVPQRVPPRLAALYQGDRQQVGAQHVPHGQRAAQAAPAGPVPRRAVHEGAWRAHATARGVGVGSAAHPACSRASLCRCCCRACSSTRTRSSSSTSGWSSWPRRTRSASGSAPTARRRRRAYASRRRRPGGSRSARARALTLFVAEARSGPWPFPESGREEGEEGQGARHETLQCRDQRRDQHRHDVEHRLGTAQAKA